VPVTRVPRFGSVLSTPIAPTFPLWWRRFSADVIHVHLANPLATFAYEMVPNSQPLVVTYHMDVVKRPALCKLYAPFLQRFLQQAEVILTTSPRLIETSPYLQPHRKKCVPVPYGIDTAQFASSTIWAEATAAVRERYGTPLILFNGRLVHYKGLDCLLKALKWVDATLILIGYGELEEPLRNLAERLSLAERVHFLGRVENHETPAYYHACDLVVLPSVNATEAFGIVQLEAMACGKPVVCTEVGTGTSWVNQHGVTGLVVPPRDPEALAEAINTLLANPDLREEMGRKGRERVEKEFTKEIMAQRVLEVYREVVGD